MKRVAIFGNAGGGKSTLALKLSAISGLPLHVVDMLQCGPGGTEIPPEEYFQNHNELVSRSEWIIDGYGGAKSLWPRLEAADTLIHVDLPLGVHLWWVTKRLIKGLVSTPAGWPEGSPVWSSSMSSYRVLRLCHRHLTPKYRAYLSEAAGRKQVYHLRSKREIEHFLEMRTLEIESVQADEPGSRLI